MYYYLEKFGNLSKTIFAINEEENEDDNNDDTEYNDLKKESLEKDEKLKALEKEYLETISRLLIMVQVHCEIKTDMYQKFAESGALKDEKKDN